MASNMAWLLDHRDRRGPNQTLVLHAAVGSLWRTWVMKKVERIQADPEWHRRSREDPEEAGAIVANVKNFILAPTPYSSVQ